MPAPGHFSLHSRAVPDLPAGSYTVQVTQDISAPGSSPEQMTFHIEITAPRFLLPPDQVLSTFPPNQSEGEYSTRLPQIVLKRRTLPWERELDGRQAAGTLPREIPWLALVVLADAECEFRTGRPVSECVTRGVALEGRNDVSTGNCIVVTERVVRQVFPTKEELPLLAHVREVDLNDTELAGGDDDGWLAVVLSNRLPQPGVRYRACLISLEGQYDVLPDPPPVEDDPLVAFAEAYVYENAAAQIYALEEQSRSMLDGADGMQIVSGGTAWTNIASSARANTTADAWSAQSDALVGAKKSAYEHTLPVKSGVRHAIGALHGVKMDVIDPGAMQYIFPVLAHWQFTCQGNRDFQSLMQALDVAMLGSLPKPPPAPQPGQKPPPPRTRPLPEVLDTGHISLGYTSRLGEAGSVWYRGPLTPRPTRREQPDEQGRLPMLHASDQARRVGPDGRENLSLAAAFEIGRLLALAEPSVVAALLTWRKEGFEQARQAALLDKDSLVSGFGETVFDFGFAERVNHQLIAGLGASGAKRLGPVRPPVDPGLEIEAIDRVDLVSLLATGFQVPMEIVSDLIEPGITRAGPVQAQVEQPVTDLEELALRSDIELAQLHEAVLQEADRLAEQIIPSPGEPGPGEVPGGPRPNPNPGSPRPGPGKRRPVLRSPRTGRGRKEER